MRPDRHPLSRSGRRHDAVAVDGLANRLPPSSASPRRHALRQRFRPARGVSSSSVRYVSTNTRRWPVRFDCAIVRRALHVRDQMVVIERVDTDPTEDRGDHCRDEIARRDFDPKQSHQRDCGDLVDDGGRQRERKRQSERCASTEQHGRTRAKRCHGTQARSREFASGTSPRPFRTASTPGRGTVPR